MENVFAKGMFVEKPSEKAPEFIKAKISFKVADVIEFLKEHENNAGYVNCDLKESKEGKLYLQLNTFKVEKPKGMEEKGEDSIPF